MGSTKQLSVVVRAVAGLMLLIAIGDLPYAYYQLLRIVVCGASIFMIWYYIQVKIEWLGWLFVVPAILFNPLFPIYMDKSTWQVWDLIFGLAFLSSLLVFSKEKQLR